MSVTKRANSKYWYCQFQINHKLVIRSTRTTDKRLARQICAAMRTEAMTPDQSLARRTITVHKAIEVLVQAKQGTPNHRNLVGHQRSLCRAISQAVKMDELTVEMVDHWVCLRRAEGAKPQTVKHGVNMLSQAIKLAKRNGYRVRTVEMPRITVQNQRVRYLSDPEQTRLLTVLQSRVTRTDDRTRQALQLVLVLLDTGARYSEITSLRWDQIDLVNNTIRLWRSKVANESLLFMTDRVLEVFRQRSKDSRGSHVFTDPTATARLIRRAIRAAKLEGCTIHTLRHTNATRLIQNGMSLYEVKQVLGHSDIRTTMRYCHLEQATVTERARDLINKLERGNSPQS